MIVLTSDAQTCEQLTMSGHKRWRTSELGTLARPKRWSWDPLSHHHWCAMLDTILIGLNFSRPWQGTKENSSLPQGPKGMNKFQIQEKKADRLRAVCLGQCLVTCLAFRNICEPPPPKSSLPFTWKFKLSVANIYQWFWNYWVGRSWVVGVVFKATLEDWSQGQGLGAVYLEMPCSIRLLWHLKIGRPTDRVRGVVICMVKGFLGRTRLSTIHLNSCFWADCGNICWWQASL